MDLVNIPKQTLTVLAKYSSTPKLYQIHTCLARVLTIVLMVTYYLFATRSDHDEDRFALVTIAGGVPKIVLFTCGLWLSSTRLGVRFWLATYILLFPCLLNAYLSSFYLGEWFAFSAMLFVVSSYWIVTKKWRQDWARISQRPH